jgi:hypothetical protein
MGFLAWIPPESLLDRALGPDAGGGLPSLVRELEEIVLGEHFYRYTGRWDVLDHAVNDWSAYPTHTALLLEIDGAPCVFSLARARALLSEAGPDVEASSSIRVLLQGLVDCVGGEILETS